MLVQATMPFWFRVSAAVNAIFALLAVAFVVRRAVLARADDGGAVHAQERRTLFAALPVREGATVFVGDSLTERGEWAEQLGDAAIQNRGIAGDTTAGVLARAAEVAAHEPARVFLMIGVNDLARGEPVAAVVERYAAVVDALRARAPRAHLHCQSVLPVREGQAPAALTNARIRALNEGIARVAAARSCTYVDLFSPLAGPDGALDPRFTLDGLHLTGAGYAAWAQAIAPWTNAPR